MPADRVFQGSAQERLREAVSELEGAAESVGVALSGLDEWNGDDPTATDAKQAVWRVEAEVRNLRRIAEVWRIGP